MSEMDDSVVGAQHAVPAVGRPPVGRRLETSQEDRRGTGPRPTDAPEMIFDSGKLHSQLADLLQLYLARASDPDAIEKCSAKDAISCAKTLTAMMSDVQSGKPASVDQHVEWQRLESPSVGRGLRAPPFSGRAIRESCPPKAGEPLQPIRPTTPLEDALSVVLNSTDESQIPIPHERFIARMDRLCEEVSNRLEEVSSVGAQHAVPSDVRDEKRARHTLPLQEPL